MALMAIGVRPATATHSNVTAVKGSAFGYHADEISLFGGAQSDTGPTPTVTLASDASNSPQTASASTGIVQYGPATLFSSDDIDVSSSGSLGTTGSVTTSTSLKNVNKATTQPSTGSEILTADSIASTCTASGSATSGSTTLTNATLQTDSGFNDGDLIYPEAGEHDPVVITLPTTPTAGTTHTGHIHLSASSTDYFTVVFNEQVTGTDGSFRVNAAHEHFGTDPPGNTSVLKGHLYLGQSVCGVTVAPGGNHPPVAGDDAYTTNEDAVLNVGAPGVLANDTDADGDNLTVGVTSAPANGTVTLNANGSFTYTPSTNYNGADSFSYTASDGNGGSDTATVSITVNAVNDPPVAGSDAYSTTEDTTLGVPAPGVLGNDSDPDGDPLTAEMPSSPANGTLVLNPDGSFTYTPNANFSGTDSFAYMAHDPNGGMATATVTITVSGANDPPVAVDDAYSASEGTTLNINAPGVLGNDSDPDGDALTASLGTAPANGTVMLNPNGSFTYTPNAGFNGVDSFTYRASDPSGASDTATVSITVNAVNDAPVAVDDAYTTAEDTLLTVAAPGVLGNDTDAEGDALTASLATGPANGTLALNPDGSFTYTPNANYNGPDSFTYTASDGNGGSDTATVSISVTAVNDDPAALGDAYSTAENTALTVPAPGVLSNDTDVDGDALSASVGAAPANGTLALNADGSFAYTPNTGFSGGDSFTYTVSDGNGGSGTATVSINVTAVDAADLSVTLTDNPDPVAPRTALTYTVTVTNNGPDGAEGATVLTSPKGTKFVSASGATCTVVKGKNAGVRCDLGSMAPHEVRVVTITVTTPSKTGTVTATSTVSSATPDPDTTNNSDQESTTVAR
ncbi:MAG: Ig-like domain-containing protein [Actinomycetota bacterium]|nr:Ig-like domain-containing protein [Actinomycetota bacterium]